MGSLSPGPDAQAAGVPEARPLSPGGAFLGPAGGQPLAPVLGPLRHLLPAPTTTPSWTSGWAQLSEAIKLVFASVYSKASRSYFQAIDYKIEEEQMARAGPGGGRQPVRGPLLPPTSRAWPSRSTTIRWPTPSPRTASPTSPWAWAATWWAAARPTGSSRPTRSWTSCPPKEQLRNTQKMFSALDMSRTTVDLFNGGGRHPAQPGHPGGGEGRGPEPLRLGVGRQRRAHPGQPGPPRAAHRELPATSSSTTPSRWRRSSRRSWR